jgi:4-hydroxythreonine-4-phosphate dehydrogenase
MARMGDPVFVFMLTRDDATAPNARELARQALAAGVRHIGFKDVGAEPETLAALARELRAGGATTYLEVVSLDEASERESAELALRIGVGRLMGGTRPWVVAPLVRAEPVSYFPFAGRIEGHPSRLAGTMAEIVASAAEIAAIPGVDGLDLLAYRSTLNAPTLIRAVCQAVSKPVIVAGSIDSPERIAAVCGAGAYGFTVGTAALEGAFPTDSLGLAGQLAAIAAAARASNAGRQRLGIGEAAARP